MTIIDKILMNRENVGNLASNNDSDAYVKKILVLSPRLKTWTKTKRTKRMNNNYSQQSYNITIWSEKKNLYLVVKLIKQSS